MKFAYVRVLHLKFLVLPGDDALSTIWLVSEDSSWSMPSRSVFRLLGSVKANQVAGLVVLELARY